MPDLSALKRLLGKLQPPRMGVAEAGLDCGHGFLMRTLIVAMDTKDLLIMSYQAWLWRLELLLIMRLQHAWA